jgi:hypothetical protein
MGIIVATFVKETYVPPFFAAANHFTWPSTACYIPRQQQQKSTCTFTMLAGACNSLIHRRYHEQKTALVFLRSVDQPQLGKLWTRETYRSVGTTGIFHTLLVSEMSDAVTLLIWMRRGSLWSLRIEVPEKPTSIAAFANQAHMGTQQK